MIQTHLIEIRNIMLLLSNFCHVPNFPASRRFVIKRNVQNCSVDKRGKPKPR